MDALCIYGLIAKSLRLPIGVLILIVILVPTFRVSVGVADEPAKKLATDAAASTDSTSKQVSPPLAPPKIVPDQPLKVVQQATVNSYNDLVSGKGRGTYVYKLQGKPDRECDFELAFDGNKFNFVSIDRKQKPTEAFPFNRKIAVSDGSATMKRDFGDSLDEGSQYTEAFGPSFYRVTSELNLPPTVDLASLPHGEFGSKFFDTFSINVVKLPDGRLRGTYDINKFVEAEFDATPAAGYNISSYKCSNKSGGRTGDICTADWKRDGNTWYVAAWTRDELRDGKVLYHFECRFKEFVANPHLAPELFSLQALHLKSGSRIIDLRPPRTKHYTVFDPVELAKIKPGTMAQQMKLLARGTTNPGSAPLPGKRI